MAVTVEIATKHLKDMIAFYVEKQKAAKSQINAAEKDLRELTLLIAELRNTLLNATASPESPQVQPAQYNTRWPWARKISFAIERAGRPLTTREIVEHLSEYEPEFIEGKKRAIASVSSTLSVKTAAGQDFEKIQGEEGDFLYNVKPDEIWDSGYGYVGPDTIPIQTKMEESDDLPF